MSPSRQALLKLPAQHQTKELCFIMGLDKTMGAVSARLDPSLPSLLAVVNRSRTMFGDFDAVKRDDAAIRRLALHAAVPALEVCMST
jgi:hypothetical protein